MYEYIKLDSPSKYRIVKALEIYPKFKPGKGKISNINAIFLNVLNLH